MGIKIIKNQWGRGENEQKSNRKLEKEGEGMTDSTDNILHLWDMIHGSRIFRLLLIVIGEG